MTDMGHGHGQHGQQPGKDLCSPKFLNLLQLAMSLHKLYLCRGCVAGKKKKKEAEVLFPGMGSELEAGRDETSQPQEAAWDVKGNSAMRTTPHISVSSILKHLILLLGHYIWGTVCSGIPAGC